MLIGALFWSMFAQLLALAGLSGSAVLLYFRLRGPWTLTLSVGLVVAAAMKFVSYLATDWVDPGAPSGKTDSFLLVEMTIVYLGMLVAAVGFAGFALGIRSLR